MPRVKARAVDAVDDAAAVTSLGLARVEAGSATLVRQRAMLLTCDTYRQFACCGRDACIEWAAESVGDVGSAALQMIAISPVLLETIARGPAIALPAPRPPRPETPVVSESENEAEPES